MRRLTALGAGAGLALVGSALYVSQQSAPKAHFREGPAGEAEPLPPLARVVPPAHGYDVVLIVVDTLRADHLSSWGYPRPTSPNIDALAARAIRFSQARSQAAWTTASIGSLMTSRYATSLGIEEERSALPEDVQTLAESLREAGLATGAFVSHSFCSDEYNFDQGFERFDDDAVLGHAGISSDRVTDAALSWRATVRGKPSFTWAHYFDPHFAYIRHDARFDPEVAYTGPVRSDAKFSELTSLRLSAEDVGQLHRLYDSEIAHTDAAIGRLLADIDPARTVVVLTADHGEEFLEHGRLGHSKTVYDELVRVPLIVACPHWEPGVVDVPVANLDIFPTVLACLGAAPPPGLVGRPLGPERPTLRTVFTQTAKRNGIVAAIHGTDKIVRSRRGVERYDLAADPGERRDLGVPADSPLLAELVAWEEALRAGAGEPVAVERDEAERARLEALGYVGE